MKLLLYPHAGSGNHGCEAIVRSTQKVLRADITLCSSNPRQDETYQLDKICNIINDKKLLSKKSPLYWKAFLQYHILNNKTAFDTALFNPIIQNALNVNKVLSIGGDNYCYNTPQFIYLINKELKKRKIETILWGCSIEPSIIDEVMMKDLSSYNHIYTRESITYTELKKRGIQNVTLSIDPAFHLNRMDLPLPLNFIENNTVGINVSPMIINRENKKGITIINYIKLIEFIISQTNMNIALIPHVIWEHDDDRTPLDYLYNLFIHTGRITKIKDCNAEELRGYIARCRFIITARTHASIAAYAEKVPTLVVGYSIKAKGIARDLFNDETKYTIPVQTFNSEYDLTNSFKNILYYEDKIRNHYDLNMNNYLSRMIENI